MKISKDRLKQLIKEELSVGFGAEGPAYGMDHEEYEEHEEGETHDKDGRMAKQNLWKLADYASKLYSLIDDEEDLEPWVEEKIAIAAFMMDSVGHYMEYEKFKDGAGESCGTPAPAAAVAVVASDDEEYEFDDSEDEPVGGEDEPAEESEDEPADEEADDEVADDEVADDEVADDEEADDEVADDEVADDEDEPVEDEE